MKTGCVRVRGVAAVMLAGGLALLSCWKVDANLKLSTHKLDFGSGMDQATFTVTNDSRDNALTTGVTLLDYKLACNRPWVTISPASGRCGGGDVVTHTVVVDRSGLSDGENLATISATSNGGSDQLAVRVLAGGTVGCTKPLTALSLTAPADGATGVALNATLSWRGGESQCTDHTSTYDVYFGTTSPPPFDHNNGAGKQWDPGTLSGRQTYHWKIVAKDANGNSSSGERSFTTACSDDTGASLTAPCSPSPGNGKQRVNTKTNAGWACGVTDCGDAVTYTFYFGKSSALGDGNILGTTKVRTFDLPNLENGVTYYWKVVAHAGITDRSGPVWSFKTRN